MLKEKLMPYVINMLTSDRLLQHKRDKQERRRRRNNTPHEVHVYLRINDPYSYVLLQALPTVAERFDVSLVFHTVLNMEDEMYPAPELWSENAFQDGKILAKLYGLQFPKTAPIATDLELEKLSAQLLHWELQPDFLTHSLPLFHAFWSSDKKALKKLLEPSVVEHAECYQHHLSFNENHLHEDGHYMSGMLHYGGEWYWGLDRLDHLERRLNQLSVNHNEEQVLFNKTYDQFCGLASDSQIKKGSLSKPLVLYFSARSPYSFLGLIRAVKLARHYNVELIIKPVLPMIMRKMQVPKRKMHYILADIKRETKKLGVPFGFFADPLGAGVERCYALFDYAQEQGLAAEYLLSFVECVYSEGVVAASDAGMKKIVERSGLDWQVAQPLLENDDWRVWAQQNLAELYSHNQWGVPSFAYGNVSVFGQDRLCEMERLMVADL
jgi:2-hydroxychromene-2-carboxylate isomerase